jgi:hypothetical protein
VVQPKVILARTGRPVGPTPAPEGKDNDEGLTDMILPNGLELAVSNKLEWALNRWAPDVDGMAADCLSEAVVDALREFTPYDHGRHLDADCYATLCTTRPTWRVRKAITEEDTNAGVWLGACTRHLNWVSDDITAGEQCALDLERILTKE